MPNSLIAFVVLVAALTPGYSYHRCFQRYAARDDRGTTSELVELFLAGALSSALAAVLLLLLGEALPMTFLRLRDLVSGHAFVQAHPWQAAWAGVLAFLVSIGVATATGWLLGRRTIGGGLNLRQGNVWVRAFTRRHQGRKPYLAVELDDGRIVEGYLLYCSTDADPSRRDLALQGPLAGSRPDGGGRTRLPAVSIVIPAGRVRLVHVSYPEQRRRVSAPVEAGTAGDGPASPPAVQGAVAAKSVDALSGQVGPKASSVPDSAARSVVFQRTDGTSS
jgi:hypothetical protein